MDTDDAAGGRLAPEAAHPPSLAERSLRRHTPKVEAVCGKAARTALCGGRSVMSVPTASACVRSGSKAEVGTPKLLVRLTPESGHRGGCGQGRLRVDSVEKVESNATEKTSLKLAQSELRQEKPL